MQKTLANSHGIPSGRNGKGDSQPPRNMMEASVATRIMLAYSAMKNNANAMPKYPQGKPIISDSPSATSNGARFVSATEAIKYTMNNGKSGSQYHCQKPP